MNCVINKSMICNERQKYCMARNDNVLKNKFKESLELYDKMTSL